MGAKDKVFTIDESREMKKRQNQADYFYQHVLEALECDRPYFMGDNVNVYSIYFGTDDDLLTRIEYVYGVKLQKEQLNQPFWKLLDLIEDKKTKLNKSKTEIKVASIDN